jgi:hypothetical protein
MTMTFARDEKVDTDDERRDPLQPSERLLGRVISCTGARAVISSSATELSSASSDFWSIGRLISINLGESRIIGLVYQMQSVMDRWSEDKPNILHIHVELIGEMRDKPDGGLSFSRGITTYPYLGAVAHRIRSRDLAAVYEKTDNDAVEIGRLTQDLSIPAMISIDGMLKRHFAVVGTTGVGKSSSVSLLLRKSVETKPDLRVLILDPHNEFAHAFPDKSVVLDGPSLELPFWVFRLEEFVEVVFRGRSGIEEEIDILRDLIPTAKANYRQREGTSSASLLLRRSQESNSNITADTPVPYRMGDLTALIDEQMGKLDSKHDKYKLRTLKNRLDTLCHDPRFRFMFPRATVDDNLAALIGRIFRVPHEGKPITVFELAALPSEVLNSVASVLARMAFDLALWSGGAYEILLLCEEAHRYVPQDASAAFVPTRQAIARIAKEGRKYGCYLGVITQRPGELDPTILSQCSTVFAMRLANDRDQEIIRSAISGSSASTVSFLSSIGNREAIAFGEAVATPMRMRFSDIAKKDLPASTTVLAAEGAPTNQLNLREIVSRMRNLDRPQE